MNLNMIRPKNETGYLLLSITKIVQLLFSKSTLDQKKHWNLKWLNQEKRII